MSEVQPVISVKKLLYTYSGRIAVNRAQFDVAPQTIHGFIGQNGAGKTTTLKVVATLLEPTYGYVRVFGQDVVRGRYNLRRRLGYMPDDYRAYDDLTVFEYLDYFASSFGFQGAERDQAVAQAQDTTGTEALSKTLIRELSTGHRQRVTLARTLVHDPDLLVLDEPASGLDPRSRLDFLDILRRLRERGKTVFVSSHILGDLAEICDEVTILDRGSVAFSGTLGDLLRGRGVGYVLDTDSEAQHVERLLDHELVQHVGPVEGRRSFRIRLRDDTVAPTEVLRKLLSLGVTVKGFRPDEQWLHEVYLDLTRPGVH